MTWTLPLTSVVPSSTAAPQRGCRRSPSCRTKAVLRSVAIAVLGLVASVTPDHAQQPQRPALVPMPQVSLDAMEPAVREQLEAQRQRLEAANRDDAVNNTALGSVYGELGQLYLLYDLVSPAETALTNARTLQPIESRWAYLLGTLYELDGRRNEAASAYRSASQGRPGASGSSNGGALVTGPARARLGRTLLSEGDLEGARQQFETLAGMPQFEAFGTAGLGRVAAARGNHAAAVELLSAALALQPDATQLHYALGLSFRALGELDRARFHMENRGDREVSFPDPIVADLHTQAAGVGARLMLGRMSLTLGELDDAETRFREALAVDPQSVPAQRAMANVALQRGRTEEAIERYRGVSELAPDDAGLHYFLAKLLIDSVAAVGGQSEEANAKRDLAVEHLRTTVELVPGFFPAHVELGEVLTRLGRFEEADREYTTALELESTANDVHYLRAQAFAAHLNHDARRAAAELSNSETLDLDHWGELGRKELNLFLDGIQYSKDPAQRQLAPPAELDLAILELRLGETERGRQRLRVLVDGAEVPTAVAAGAAFHLGNQAAEAGHLEEAIRDLRRAIDLDPEFEEALFNLATVLGRSKRYAEAATLHERILALDPANQAAAFSHAMALILDGSDRQARTALEESLERFPSEPAFAHLLARLLVASTDDQVRDATLGLDLALRLFDSFPTVESGETVAMAFAEAGRFDKAVEWQARIVEQLRASGQPTRAAENRLLDYRSLEPARSPWLQTPLDTKPR